MSVYVLDRKGRPLMPCSEKRARKMLEAGRARVHRLIPFTIRLTDRTVENSVLQPVRVKLDPGSKHTGIAVVRDNHRVDQETGEHLKDAAVINLIQLDHRGASISMRLTARRAYRRRRRSQLRYRPARFNNRKRHQGWLPPSLRHRLETTMSWITRLRRWCPVTGLSTELVKFDMTVMDPRSIEDTEYDPKDYVGYQVREYLLEKYKRTCIYCDIQGVPLQIEHLHPRAKGGSNRISNLGLACKPCNQKKGAKPLFEFLAHDPERYRRIVAQMRKPLKDTAAVNATRKELVRQLLKTGLPVETGSGGLTKWNRSRLGIPKEHALDAACVGYFNTVEGWKKPKLQVKCTGRGRYRRTYTNSHGFPKGYSSRSKSIKGFRTGDICRSKEKVIKGKYENLTLKGKIVINKYGKIAIKDKNVGLTTGLMYLYFDLIQKADGYEYS